jgi:hypothetical protein
MVKELELCSKHHITSIFRNTIYNDPYLDWIIIELQFRFAYINFLQNVHGISFFFPFAVVNLTLIDLPGLTKVAVGTLLFPSLV